MLSELNEALNQARLDAAGGDIEARKTLKNIRAMIDDAAARDAIHPAMLMMLGRLFAGAQIEIGVPRARRWAGRWTWGLSRAPRRNKPMRRFCGPGLSARAIRSVRARRGGRGSHLDFSRRHYRSAFVERMAVDPMRWHPPDRGRFPPPSRGGRPRRRPSAASAPRRASLDDERRRWIEAIRPWLAPARRSALDAGASRARAAPLRGRPRRS